MAQVFSRKAYGKMLEWKANLAGKSALLIEGARRVGKTFLVRRFVESEYESSIYIDFSVRDARTRNARKAFAEMRDIPDLLERLSLIYAVKLTPGRSCIVFDEVQLFPAARESVKHLVAHGKYHYIESGSLVGIKENVKDIMIPSEEHGLKIYPLDFEEFLDATGYGMLKEKIRSCFAEKKPLGFLHDEAMHLFRVHMLVGGMPQSVEAYVSNEDDRFGASEAAKRDILGLYDADIGKYAKGYASKVRAIFRTIPSALARHEKKFKLSEIDSSARMRRYENAFLWLSDAMVVNIACNATSPDLGLAMNLDVMPLKCYSLDTGLLATQSMSGERESDARLMRAVLYDKIGVNEGMFFENVVAQTLKASGHDLFFFSRRDQRDSSGAMEIDFLLRKGLKISPVEVKSSRSGMHASLDKFMSRYKRHIGLGYLVCNEDFGEDGALVRIPAYMAHCL